MGAAKKDRELWTLDDVVSYLKIPKSTVQRYIALKKIPFIQIGRHRRFDPDAVERAVKRMPA